MRFPFVTLHKFDALAAARDRAIAERDYSASLCDAARRERDVALKTIARITRANGSVILAPICSCRKRAEWENFLSSPEFALIRRADEDICADHRLDNEWSLAGYSLPAQDAVFFEVDLLWGGNKVGDERHPNLRERLVCPTTHLNDRQRLVASIACAELSRKLDRAPVVYIMEQVTPIFRFLVAAFPSATIIGSEFLGDHYGSGEVIDGIRNESVPNLSFDDSTFDLVISNDVMEHVPSPQTAFKELARVLRGGGQVMMTIPFSTECDHSIVRAENVNGTTLHHREPVYHGNHLSSEGSLVFTDFGWDALELAKECGFKDAFIEVYHSVALGHLGLGLVFRLIR